MLGGNTDSLNGALALVRSGAVYLDPATGRVLFHPWGGDPSVVGHNSAAGPGGDPNGDTAAWFEGSELVVYDTAAGREISRTEQRGNVVSVACCEHMPPGNGFLQVPGRAEERYPDLEPRARLSPSGNYALAIEGTEERHAAAILDTRTGELWRVPGNAYPWIAWSYGDIARVDTEDGSLACDAARRACEPVHPERPLLMPTN